MSFDSYGRACSESSFAARACLFHGVGGINLGVSDIETGARTLCAHEAEPSRFFTTPKKQQQQKLATMQLMHRK